MNCSEFNILLDRILHGTVSSEERAAMDRHAAGCRNCTQLLAAQELIAATFEATEPVGAPPDLADRIRNRIDAETAGVVLPFEATGDTAVKTDACMVFESDMVAFVDGLLSDDRMRIHADHRASCETCDRLARAHETVSAAFATTEPITAPAGLADRIRAAALESQTATDPFAVVSRFRRFIVPAAAAAFIGVFTGGLLLNGLRSSEAVTPGPFAQMIDSIIVHITMLPALFEAWIARSIPADQWIVIARLLEPVELPYLPFSFPRLLIFTILAGAVATWGLVWRFITSNALFREQY